MNPAALVFVLVTIPALALTCVTPGGRPIGLISIGSADGKAYFVDRDVERTWTEAGQYCQSLGMQLGSAQTLQQLNVWRYITDPDFELCDFWTAGRDETAPSHFVWNGTEVQPPTDGIEWQNYAQTSTCLYFSHYYEQSFFVMIPCSYKTNVICEQAE